MRPRRWRELLIPLALLACVAHAPSPGPELARRTLISGGRERTFLAYRPEGPGPFPLVISLHGRFGNGAEQDTLSHSSALAQAERFALVLPDGFHRSWHDARDYGPAAEANIDDVQFLSDLIDDAVATLGADPKRVYMMGMSNGAFMTLTAACRLSSRLAGVGAVTGGVSVNLARRCELTQPLSVALVLGTKDPLVPWAGGGVVGDHGDMLSAEASAQFWVQQLHCAADAQKRELPDVDADDHTRTTMQRWAGCDGANEVRLYAVEGGGHTWPGGPQYLPSAMVGPVSRDFDATAELWKMLSSHAR